MTGYYPEMGEQPDTSNLFQARHVIGGAYSLRWSLDDDERARGVFRSARVRPSIEFTKAENTYSGSRTGRRAAPARHTRKGKQHSMECRHELQEGER